MSPVDMQLAADGNYVKARVGTSDLAELEEIRQMLLDAGAKGVIVLPEIDAKAGTRGVTAIKKGMTLHESVASFVDASSYEKKAELNALCAKLLTDATSVSAE
jgi:predicted transcriptional regulator